MNVSSNDIYSHFITDDLTKSQINDYLKSSSKQTYKINNEFIMSTSTQNEVIVDKGTSGFRRRSYGS
ncbi:hypothetical protein LY90DRAFT_706621, partial [Neocallimastix californiae]